MFDHYNVFDIAEQQRAVQESLTRQLDCEFIPDENEEQDGPDEYEEQSSDEEKDVLDIMKEIHHGTRRSARTRKQPDTLYGYMSVDPTKLNVVPYDDDSSSTFSSTSSSSSSSKRQKTTE